MAKSGLLTGTRTIYDKSSGSSKGDYAIQYYDLNNDLSIGITWDIRDTTTQYKISPGIIRWDSSGTDNYSGTFDEILTPDANNNMGTGSWDDISWSSGGSASGWTGWYDSFSWRTYNKGHSAQTIKLTIKSYNLYSYGCGEYGSDTSTFSTTIPALASYSVSYNANGGSGAPSAQTKWYGETLTLSSTKPTRTGYVFSKWNTKSNGSGTNYSSGGSYTANAGATLYAQWTEAKVTVNYHINGGTLTAQTTAGATATVYRASNSLVQSYNPSATTPAWTTIGAQIGSTVTYANLYNVATFPITKTGHHIVASSAWNLKADGTGSSFHQDDTAENTVNKVTTIRLNGGTQISSNVTKTLYVKWVPDTYTVAYDANGGTSTPTSQTKTYGVALTLRAGITKNSSTTTYTVTYNYNGGSGTVTSNSAVKTTPYSFSCWKATNGTTYAASGSYTANAATTMTAQWTTGTSSTTTVALPTGTRTNHTIQGWYTVSATTGGTKRGNAGGSYTPTQSETLYARWGYNVTYNKNFGTTTPTAQVKTPGTALTLQPAITRNNATATYTVTFNYNGNGTADTTSSAVKTTQYSFTSWKATSGTTYAASGSYAVDEPTVMTAQWSSSASTTTVALPSPTWTNYTLDGWYTVSAATGGTKRGNGGASYTPTQSETLYARWIANTFTITYNGNGGTATPAVHTGIIGQNLRIADSPTRDGYIFSQWNTAADGTGGAYGRGSFYTGPDDLTLYAIWTKIKTVEDLEAVTIDDINKSIPISLVPNIWNKITTKFYGKTLYEFTGTIDWSTIRTTPGTNDLTITLSEACYNYQRLLVIGQTCHSTYVTATIINPQRNKQFTLNDNFAYHNLNLTTPEPFTLYMRQVPWTISSNGLQIQQTGTYGQRYLRESTQTAGWSNNFNIKIIKVIAFKN